MCTIEGLPPVCIPKEMVKALPTHVIRNLNQFLVKSGISKDTSPLTIITGAPRPDYNNLKLEFGEHVEVYEDNKQEKKFNQHSWNPLHHPMPR